MSATIPTPMMTISTPSTDSLMRYYIIRYDRSTAQWERLYEYPSTRDYSLAVRYLRSAREEHPDFDLSIEMDSDTF